MRRMCVLMASMFISGPMAFAHSDNSMTESETVSSDQIAKYEDLPQTIVLRVRKSRGSWVEAARTQRRLAHDSVLKNLRFEQIAPNFESEALPVVKQANLDGGRSLVTDRTVPIEPYFFGFRPSSRGVGQFQAHRSSHLGYPYIRYHEYTYMYLPYGSAEDADYIYAFYSWTNYYQ